MFSPLHRLRPPGRCKVWLSSGDSHNSARTAIRSRLSPEQKTHKNQKHTKTRHLSTPKCLQNRAKNQHKINFQRLRAKKPNLVKTSVFTVSNTHRTPPGLNNFLSKSAPEHCKKRFRKKTDKGAQQNACRLDFGRQRTQKVSQKAPN